MKSFRKYYCDCAGLFPIVGVLLALLLLLLLGGEALAASQGQVDLEPLLVVWTGSGGSGVFAILLITLLSFGKAVAATYYVRTGGDDGNSGTTAVDAWATFAKATSSTAAGDVVYFGSGAYNELVKPSVDGTSGSPIRFIADTSGAITGEPVGDVILDGPAGGKGDKAVLEIDQDDYLEFTGFKITGDEDTLVQLKNSTGGVVSDCEIYESKNGVKVDGSGVDFSNCIIRDNSDDGIDIDHAGPVTISDSTVSGNSKSGVKLDDSTVSILRSTLQNNGDHGIEIKKGDNTIVNCLIIENGETGIEFDKNNATVGTVWNCTIADNTSDGILSGEDGKGSPSGGDVTVTNSIIADNGGFGLSLVGGTMTHTYNDVHGNVGGNYDGTSAGTGETTSDPEFVDPANDAYQIVSTSPAFNTGTDASGTVDDDIRGKPRPVLSRWDMGCYELSSGEGGLPILIRISKWEEIR